jgi:hypothetical protein
MDHHKVGQFRSGLLFVTSISRRVQKVGMAVFGLYMVQVILGAFIHFIRIPFPLLVHRPLLNYAHALLGLTILSLSGYQVCHLHA